MMLMEVVVAVSMTVEVRIGYVSVGGIESGVAINTQVGNGALVSCNVRTSQQIHSTRYIPVLGGSCPLLEQAVRREKLCILESLIHIYVKLSCTSNNISSQVSYVSLFV